MVKSPFIGIAATLLIITIFDSAEPAAVPPPPDAVAAGFTLNTFTAFTNASVDIDNTGRSGFSWYPWNFFGGRARPENIVLNPDSSVTLIGDVTGPNGQLATATAKKGAKFAGIAFGGGAYVEASIRFDPAVARNKGTRGFPSFWALPLEHAATGADQWNGKPQGFEHFIEVDFFEYDINEPNLGPNYYGANMHDWYGVYNKTCAPRGFCDVSRIYSDVKTAVRGDTDFTQFHLYGFLWVPATESTMGYAQFYFDRNPVGRRVTWTKFMEQSDAPDGQSWQFGALDNQHLVLILGTGVNKPMTVDSVNVWQSSNNQNMRN